MDQIHSGHHVPHWRTTYIVTIMYLCVGPNKHLTIIPCESWWITCTVLIMYLLPMYLTAPTMYQCGGPRPRVFLLLHSDQSPHALSGHMDDINFKVTQTGPYMLVESVRTSKLNHEALIFPKKCTCKGNLQRSFFVSVHFRSYKISYFAMSCQNWKWKKLT